MTANREIVQHVSPIQPGNLQTVCLVDETSGFPYWMAFDVQDVGEPITDKFPIGSRWSFDCGKLQRIEDGTPLQDYEVPTLEFLPYENQLMKRVSIEGIEYLVGTIAQAEISARLNTVENIELVDTDLLLEYCNLPPHAKGLIEIAKSCACGSMDDQDVLAKLVSDPVALGKAAVAKQGRAVFLSSLEREHSLSEFPLYAERILEWLGLPSDQCDEVRLYPE